MVGVGTVLADDPGLRVKSIGSREARRAQGWPEDPLRVVADSQARTPPDASVLGPGCLIAVSSSALQERLEKLSPRCEIVKCGIGKVDLEGLMDELHRRGIKRLMVEGGARLNWSLIRLGLVDELYVYIGGMIIGGESAPTLVDGQGFRESYPRLRLDSLERLDEGALLKWSLEDRD
jgi:2,5-diamino-6-(ribosylamino)-4(3H)-pyrimidinone 5'-phosphate reductase